MAALEHCPRCGRPPAYDHTHADGVRFKCLKCDDAVFEGCDGAVFEDFEEAAVFWNMRVG